MKSYVIGVSLFSLSIATLLLAGFSSPMQESMPRCYEILSDGPERTPEATEPRRELWCYHELMRPFGAQYIYNVDDQTVRPELAMLVEEDGFITHGSLAGGEVTLHRVHKNEYNPMAVPLEPPAGSREIEMDHSALQASARDTLDLFLEGAVHEHSIAIADIQASVIEDESAARLPWRGYWWSYKTARLYKGSASPLAKYDRVVKAHTGQNPGAAAWESSRHRYKGVWWEGHCNGWVASAILRAEPRQVRTEPRSGISFKVSDQKGLLAELDYCAKVAFYGSRYRGRNGQDRRDIYPAEFHRTILYYIGSLRKAVAIDYRSDAAVDNHIVSKYSLSMRRIDTNRYSATMVLRIHKYDGARHEKPAVAPTYQRTYRYELQVDDDGNAIGGRWLSGNPDFLWVPLSPTSCGSNNPQIESSWVERIVY